MDLIPNYIGPNSDISSDLKKALNIAKTRENFIEALKTIGYAIGSLSNYDSEQMYYNTTDSITTSRALLKLFNPVIVSKYIPKTNSPTISKTCNLINVTISGPDFHKFIMIKLDTEWYLMDSLLSESTLRIIQINPNIILQEMNVDMFNYMFNRNVSKKAKLIMETSCGLYDKNYYIRFVMWMKNRL